MSFFSDEEEKKRDENFIYGYKKHNNLSLSCVRLYLFQI
jgi:hypothetical protein